MQIAEDDLEAAAKEGIITNSQAKKLWLFWQNEYQDVPSFRLSHLLYYFGGLLAISAITLFVTQAWDTLQGLPLFILSTLLFLLGLFLTHYFLRQKKLPLPAGIMATFSLAVIPLAMYNIQLWLGYQPPYSYHYADYHAYVNWFWVPMEIATLLVGVILFFYYRFPFLLFPIAITLWYMSMDLVPLLFNVDFSWSDRATFSMWFGIFILLLALYCDLRYSNRQKDYGFWLYIFGVMAFWGGLSMQESNNEFSKFIYCLINVAMIFLSVFLDRRVFAVFGTIGVLGYLGHLAFTVFPNSLAFPIVLVFLGLFIIFAATRWVRMEQKLTTALKPYIPEKILRRRNR